MKSVLEGILSALAYHDGFDAPLTAQEIFFALPATEGTRPSFEDVDAALAEACARGHVSSREGFYCLPGREAVVSERKSRYALAEGKYARVRKFLRLARHIPYVRAAFVCNTLARSNARPESDIDLYVVAAPGRIWSTRLIVAGLAALLGVRPTATESADRICLSFFVTGDALNLRALAIEDDVYLAHWLHELYPVYDEAGITRRSYVENGWLRSVLPETRVQTPSQRRALPSSWLSGKRTIERALDAALGDRLERWSKRRQMAWLPPALRAAAGAGSSNVVLSDTVLKFHDHDRRTEIRDRYREKTAHVLRALA
ncbi:MAG: hypothetical protein QY323_05405 [Patescibacteria group bacterium]|nr:MAG: hypothetical protein QY323_05405 [Patescibacteria group bacterium]